jgi:hypothetical protein
VGLPDVLRGSYAGVKRQTAEVTHSDTFHDQGIKLARMDLAQWPHHAYHGFQYT